MFYRHPLHIYRIEAMAAKPDQDAEARRRPRAHDVVTVLSRRPTAETSEPYFRHSSRRLRFERRRSCSQSSEPAGNRKNRWRNALAAWDYKFALAIQALFPAGRTAPRLGLALIATSVRFFAFNFLIIFRT